MAGIRKLLARLGVWLIERNVGYLPEAIPLEDAVEELLIDEDEIDFIRRYLAERGMFATDDEVLAFFEAEDAYCEAAGVVPIDFTPEE